MSLSLNGIKKCFSKRGDKTPLAVIQDFTWTFTIPQIVCLMGQSGCGKTTLVRLLAGLINPDEGTISLESTNVMAAVTVAAAVVFQQTNCLPWLTVEENIRFPELDSRSISKEEMRITLQKLGLTGYEKYYPKQLSGGMQQRVAIGRLLHSKQLIWILDEAFTGLDPHTRKQMVDLVMTAARDRGCLCIYVTHNIEEALNVSDTILILSTLPTKPQYVLQTRKLREVSVPAYNAAQELEKLFSEESPENLCILKPYLTSF